MSKKPRILAVDFSDADVQKFVDAGFTAHRASTGLDEGQFYSPVDVQNIEIAVINLRPDALNFTQMDKRKPHTDSLEKVPFFQQLIEEVTAKHGWVIVFVHPNANARECENIGIEYLGVMVDGRQITAPEWNDIVKSQHRVFHPFKAANIFKTDEPEVAVLEKYSQHEVDYHIVSKVKHGSPYKWESLLRDEAADKNALATKMEIEIYDDVWDPKTGFHDKKRRHGAILILPNYREKNADVVLDLLKEVIPDANHELFDDPEHTWLDECLPHPALEKYSQRDALIVDTQKQVEALNKAASNIIKEYSWLTGLLTTEGDDFAGCATSALTYLGFRVEDMDETVQPGAAKREDAQIFDDAVGYFVLGEFKATARGANQEMLTKVSRHQMRYARENKVPPPAAVMIVNHSIKQEPNDRIRRFYTDKNDRAMCIDNGIVAVDSVALHKLCQDVLAGLITKNQARELIRTGTGVITTLVLPAVAPTDGGNAV